MVLIYTSRPYDHYVVGIPLIFILSKREIVISGVYHIHDSWNYLCHLVCWSPSILFVSPCLLATLHFICVTLSAGHLPFYL